MPGTARMSATGWMQATAVTQATTVTPATSNSKDDSIIMIAHNSRNASNSKDDSIIMIAHNSRNASNSRNNGSNRTNNTISTSSKAGILAKAVKLKYALGTLEWAYFSFYKCPI
jgi:hypothetical protein